jgi:hypothetical protein
MHSPIEISRARRASFVATLLAAGLLGCGLADGLASEPAPLVQQGAKLTGHEEIGQARFGRSAALSANGDTALIGAPRDNGEIGAVWVYTRSGSTWAEQAKLTPGEALGAPRFGRSVSLSADGNTALVGGSNDGGVGAAWVYTRSGSTWTQQAKLTGGEEIGSGWFGWSVALSADGETALVGGYVDHSNLGAAWVFKRSGTTWTQQGAKLTGGEESGAGEFGWSVALSGDGQTALIGGHADHEGQGAAWLFAAPEPGSGTGSTWTQQGTKLTGGEESGAGEFGQAVALSGDGQTALIGGRADHEDQGAAWVFVPPSAGSTWLQQGAKLTGGEESGAGEFGQSVALAADGETALIGGRADDDDLGAAWLFARAGSTWTQQAGKLTGGEESGEGELGWSAALSADGSTALLGGIDDAAKAGAAWAFAPSPDPPGGQPSGGGEPPQGTTTQPAANTTSTGSNGAAGAIATPSAGQGVAAYKALSGTVTLVGRHIAVRNGRASIVLRCTATVTCRGQLTLSSRPRPRAQAARRGGTVTLATAGFSISAGHTTIVKLALRRAGHARLAGAHGRLHANLAVRVAQPDPVRTRRYAVTLVRQRPRRG